MLEVEQVFSSYGRVKVMSVIMKSDELNISEITRRAGISHSAVALHLDFLVKAGLLTEKRFNRIRIFRVNHSNPYAAALERFLEDWRSLDPRASEVSFN
ncbi:MAG: winged helix-turn-helix domain-containing protein [Thaumarchaeota archaeon]|nr:winged helix-turn-helix domain-containing protein [Nitrososphaerota archaeon]